MTARLFATNGDYEGTRTINYQTYELRLPIRQSLKLTIDEQPQYRRLPCHVFRLLGQYAPGVFDYELFVPGLK